MIILAILLAAAIFCVDVFTDFDGAIAVLYIGVVLVLAPRGRRFAIGSGIVTALLAAAGFAQGHFAHPSEAAASRFIVALIAIAITTLLSIRDRSSRTTLQEQARILELSHDTVIIRDEQDRIIYWNDGAEELYGWSRQEALGRNCTALLQCRFPGHEVAASLDAEGHWSGEVTRSRRDGTRLVLASRWLRRRDPEGQSMGVIESSADLTGQRRASTLLEASDRKYRAIFQSAGFGTWESDWSETMRIAHEGKPEGITLADWLADRPDTVADAVGAAVIRTANPAAVELFEAGHAQALVGQNLCGRYLPGSTGALSMILTQLAAGAGVTESEIQLLTMRDRTIDVVLRVALVPEGSAWSHVIVTAFDITERNETRARFEQVSAELAHASRVSMLGQLSASITHEVNQPLTAIINYGKSAKRWLRQSEPDLAELAQCVERMIANGTRAAAVVERVRNLARKTTPQNDAIDLAELIEDTLALVQREARAQQVAIRVTRPPALPAIPADRVQVQQVLMNLMINGIQAMRDADPARRELHVGISLLPDAMVQVAVADRGTGFAQDGAARLFEPFYTTKPDGMGMGLSICRSIIESQGGRISASNNEGPGATICFTLPAPVAQVTKTPELIS